MKIASSKYVINILFRNLPKLIIDLTLGLIAFQIGLYIRSDFSLVLLFDINALFDSLIFVLSVAMLGLFLGVYTGKFRLGSVDEILAIATVSFLSSLINLGTREVLNWGTYPRSVPIIAALIFVIFSLVLRTAHRFFLIKHNLKRDNSKKVLIYGAGSLGQQIANLVTLNPKMKLVGFIDDDPYKSRLIVNGIKVVSNVKNLKKFLETNEVHQILLAMSNLDKNKIEILSKVCGEKKISLKALDTSAQMLLGVRNLEDLISLNRSTLLGREQVLIDRDEISKLIAGKSVLITGAGGSIGSEIARQCHAYKPSALYLLDRDESSLHALELEIFGTGMLTSESIILADIRDEPVIQGIFNVVKPQIVFHAAALKHLPALERFPIEAEKTNVIGTKNVLDAAFNNEVEIFVNISTDKAADPSSVLGYTKLEAEKLTYSYSKQAAGRKYLSVRFGNVIGSRGSVLHTFKYQIERDLPVTITHSDATRFFMTVQEAVELVMQSTVIGQTGETLILDMGKAVKIEEVAKFMISQSGKDIPISYIGLRPGEKLHEVLSSKTENLESRSHPKIFHTSVSSVIDEH